MFNILIIDDEEMIRFTLKSILEDEGFNIFIASDASTGLEIAKKEDIHLTIVDLHMPGIDGAELIEEIDKIKPEIKILVHTGDSGYLISQELLNKGIDQNNILFKPIVDMKILISKINNILLNDKI